ncbi:MAG: imidazole glycerol phosphate synthase cyclase subunit [Colwellia sp.]
MRTKRVIARLDVKNNALVKGIHLEGLRVLGTPGLFAKKYYDDSIDELVYMDVVASLYERNGLIDLVRETAKNIFIPLTVGGGIKTSDDISALLHAGADKICINTAAVKDPKIISEFAEKFGSSTIVVAIEAIKDTDGSYKVYIDNGREFTGLDAVEWAVEVQRLGAGEIILTSVDNEGTGKGLNFELIKSIDSKLTIPLVVHGGVGKSEDFVKAFKETSVDGVCAASIFHYEAISHLDLSSVKVKGNTSFLQKKITKKNLELCSVSDIKESLRSNNISIR